MIKPILIFLFLAASFFNLIFSILLSYHFKRFTLVQIETAKRISKIFRIVSFSLSVLSLIFLILTFR